MESNSQQHSAKQFSLRIKILIGFTLLFSGVFALAFYWFYSFATEKTMNRLFLDMRGTASGAAKEIDPNELLALYKEGKVSSNSSNISTDPRYQAQLERFQHVNNIESRAWLYTYVLVDAPPDQLKSGTILSSVRDRPPIASSTDVAQLQPGKSLPTVFLVDLWIRHNPSKAAKFLEVSSASEFTLKAYREGTIVDRPLYDDGQFGSWISTYVPLKNSVGQTVAILGIDFEADYIREVQKAILDQVLLGFVITYAFLFVLVYLLSDLFTKPILKLTKVAKQIGEGNYNNDLTMFQTLRWRDEISTLAEVLALMVNKVRQREETLKLQVIELKVEIDEVRRKKQVSEIVESDFFQNLQSKAQKLRGAKQRLQESFQSEAEQSEVEQSEAEQSEEHENPPNI